ncbi:hypothetical protein IWZ01DRAFT_527990 [Phyllosticta capitalensis]
MSDESRLEPPSNTLGLHQVYPDPKAQRNDMTIEKDALDLPIVAVHGLGGDPFSTFTRNNCLWIRDLLPSSPYFENARIMTFGYDARAFLHPFSKQTNGRVFTFAENLLGDLDVKRISPMEKRRPIIFLGHSLGGIVIKSALRYAHERRGLYGNVLDSTKAIVFFGTPHQGSDAATWAAFLGSLGRAVHLRSTEVLDELKRWSNPLVELTRVFSELRDKFQITSFYEKEATNGMIIVPEGSAVMGAKMERIRGLEADHHQVCKFTESDSNWHTVLMYLEAIVCKIREGLEPAPFDAFSGSDGGAGAAQPRVLEQLRTPRSNAPPGYRGNRQLLAAQEWDDETFGDLRYFG